MRLHSKSLLKCFSPLLPSSFLPGAGLSAKSHCSAPLRGCGALLQTEPSWKCYKARKSHTQTRGLTAIAPPLFLGYSTHLLSHLRNSGEAPPLQDHFPSIPANQLCVPCTAAHRHTPPASTGSEMAGQGSENHTQTALCEVPNHAVSPP